MGLIGKVIQAFIRNNLREIKTELYPNFIKSSYQVLPPGMDSVPIENDQGTIIVIDQTQGKTVAIGVYPDPQAEPGEVRFYSRDSAGVEKAFLWLKADGTIEINGDQDFAVAFNDLKSGFDTLKSDLNSFITTTYNLHTHATAAPGPPIVPVPTGSASAASIDAAKVDTIKVP